jgi:CheY-like chemotaxis protein/anti-sigma regulatory factor (Ser/Thr protein kinase)
MGPIHKILVADDNSNERNGLCRLLEREGYDVRSAADGVEALEKIKENSFDLLLVDIWMPRMTGIELLVLLPDDTRPKVLVITGDESPQVLLQSLREKAYRFISKPIDPADFLRVVKRALETPWDCEPIEVLSADPNWVELRFPCAIQAADRIESVVDQLNLRLPPRVRESVKTALHELLINAVKWGGHTGPDAQAHMDYLLTRRFVMCRIADPGTGFESSEPPKAVVVEHPASGTRPDGFGIKLAKSLVDELVFNESRNEVAIVKYLN